MSIRLEARLLYSTFVVALAVSPLLASCSGLSSHQRNSAGGSSAEPKAVGFDAEQLERMTAAIRGLKYPSIHAVLIESDGVRRWA